MNRTWPNFLVDFPLPGTEKVAGQDEAVWPAGPCNPQGYPNQVQKPNKEEIEMGLTRVNKKCHFKVTRVNGKDKLFVHRVRCGAGNLTWASTVTLY